MKSDKTTIAVHRDTVERLGRLGGFNDTYEDVILRLLNANSPRERVGSES